MLLFEFEGGVMFIAPILNENEGVVTRAVARSGLNVALDSVNVARRFADALLVKFVLESGLEGANAGVVGVVHTNFFMVRVRGDDAVMRDVGDVAGFAG